VDFTLGLAFGLAVGFKSTGLPVVFMAGIEEGFPDTGTETGLPVGFMPGLLVGLTPGLIVGFKAGLLVGLLVNPPDFLGFAVGVSVGACGFPVGSGLVGLAVVGTFVLFGLSVGNGFVGLAVVGWFVGVGVGGTGGRVGNGVGVAVGTFGLVKVVE